MPTWTPELVEGSSLEVSSTAIRKVTRGTLSGVAVTAATSDAEALFLALTALTGTYGALGSPLSGHSDLIFAHVLIRGYTTDGMVCDVVHETPFFGGPPSALIIRTRTQLQTVTGNTIHVGGTRVPLEILGVTIDDGTDIPDDLLTITYLKPVRIQQVSALTYGEPANGGEDAVGSVNDFFWRGYQEGFWLMSNFEVTEARYSGYYTMQAEAMTQIDQPWSYYGVLKNERTGKFLTTTELANLNTSLDGLAAGAYVGAVASVPGAARVNPYPTINFSGIMGIN